MQLPNPLHDSLLLSFPITRASLAIKKIEELEKAERQKLIEKHEAMIPQ